MAETTQMSVSGQAGERQVAERHERSANAIRQDIAARRETISETMDRLGERIQSSLDWRQQVRNHPISAIAIAAGAGLLLSGIFRPRPSPAERIMDAVADMVDDVTDRARDRIAGVLGTGFTQRIAKPVMGALLAKTLADLKKANRSAGMGS